MYLNSIKLNYKINIPLAADGPFPTFKSQFWNSGIREVKRVREIGNLAR